MPDGLLCRHVPVSRYTYSIKGCVATVPNCTTSFSVGAPGFVVHYGAANRQCGTKSSASRPSTGKWRNQFAIYAKVCNYKN